MFNDFLEGEINFAPTYKYDLFSEDYDTSEKARAPAWTDRVLWRRRMQQADAANPNWNPGRLLFYNRAELKQSDHRPVVAILDIEVANIDVDKRTQVFNEVIMSLGPPDATVVIHAVNQPSNDEDEDSIYDENVTAALVQKLAEIGEVTLVRFVGETMWVTFKDGQAALTAVNRKGNLEVSGIKLNIRLKTEDWLKQVEREIAICTANCAPLCEYIDISTNDEYNSIGIPTPDMAKAKPPSRPPLPKSPQPKQKHHHAGVIDVSQIIRPQPGTYSNSTIQEGPQFPARPCLPPRPRAMESKFEKDQITSPLTQEILQPSPAETYHVSSSSAIYEEIKDEVV